MSWDGYVDSIVGDVSVITKATLIGLNGAIWTPASSKSSKVLEISQAEASAIGPIMSKKDDTVAKAFAETGITIGGTKYMFLRDMDGDGRIMTAKKVGVGQLVVQSTIQAVIIAFFPEANSHSAGNANGMVDKIAKYLEGTGY